LERIEKLEKQVRKLEARQKIMEEFLPTYEDIKALIEAEKDLKKGKIVPLEKIEKEML